MHTLRSRVKRDIICEFVPPFIRSNGKVIVLALGLPTVPAYKKLLTKFASLGYFAITFRYRGTWESNGLLFRNSPEKDLWDVLDQLPKGLINLWDDTHIKLKFKKVIVVGSSFGGPAALLCSKHPLVDSVIVQSGVIDWQDQKNTSERISFMEKYIPKAFGQGYRFAKDGWKKIEQGKLYNPITQTSKIDAKKVVFVHAMDDDVVRFHPVNDFAKSIKSPMIAIRKGGHFSSSVLLRKSVFNKLKHLKYL